MKELKRKPSTIRLKIQKYMDRVSGDEARSPQAPDSEPITEESESELVSENIKMHGGIMFSLEGNTVPHYTIVVETDIAILHMRNTLQDDNINKIIFLIFSVRSALKDESKKYILYPPRFLSVLENVTDYSIESNSVQKYQSF